MNYLSNLISPTKSKIVLLVLDGLGGLPLNPSGLTELETAVKPNMDHLAKEGTLGQTIPIRHGVTPGSGPAHLALFGYDPLVYDIGRGALEAAGVGQEVHLGDVAARGNFCTLDPFGNLSDRRAGRITSENAAKLIPLLQDIQLPGVDVAVQLVKEYRFAIILRGPDLDPGIKDTDPQILGVPLLPAIAETAAAERTAALFNEWISKANNALQDQKHANGVMLRGFATDPKIPTFQTLFGLNPACIAVYPMYRGIAQWAGMDIIHFNGETPADEFHALSQVWERYDFFFVHIKKTDSKGEDGDFQGKVEVIEQVDRVLPVVLDLHPDVLIITADHSTPARLKSHSWHPVPFLLWAPETGRTDDQSTFGERSCAKGGLGTFSALDTLPLALAHAGKLLKYGA